MKLNRLSLTLGASGALALLIVGASLTTTAGSNPDADGDGVIDLVDNCLGIANGVNAQGWQHPKTAGLGLESVWVPARREIAPFEEQAWPHASPLRQAVQIARS